MDQLSTDQILRMVRERYGKIASSAGCGCGTSKNSSCCGSTAPEPDAAGQRIGYSPEELNSVVEGANLGLGCGNPTALGKLKPGETVLDLGSGGGFDCFLAGKAVGEEGHVIGVDMTPETLSKSRENAEKMEAPNVEFRLGEIENLPVADESVDVIISNCVINLSPRKKRVFTEAFRVLRPGGRLAVSDIVALQPLPEKMRQQAELLTGCVAGAENVDNLKVMLEDIGFQEIRISLRAKSGEWLSDWFPRSGAESYIASASIEAIKIKDKGSRIQGLPAYGGAKGDQGFKGSSE